MESAADAQARVIGPLLDKIADPPYFLCYSSGLVHASACTNLPDAEAVARLNLEHPTGIDSPWSISEDETFADGSPHPCPCPDHPTRRHVLFVC